jgi:hypothetical protein
MTDGQPASLSSCQAPIWGPRLDFYSCQTVTVWLICGPADYNWCWFSPAQSFSGPSPTGLMTIFYCLRLRLSQPVGPGLRIYIPQEQCGSVMPPGIGFSFRRLLRLAGLRWRYLNPPPCGVWFQSFPADPYDIASGRTAQRTILPTVLLLRDLTAVAERCLLRHRLATCDVFGDAALRNAFHCCVIIYCPIA